VSYRIVLDNAPGAAAAGTLSARVTSYVVRTGAGPGAGPEDEGWGLAVYGTPHEAVAAIAAAAAAAKDDEEVVDAPTRGQALTFVGKSLIESFALLRSLYSRCFFANSGPHEMPFGDLDCLESDGWPLGPGDECLPLFTKVELAAPAEAGVEGDNDGPQLEVSRPELLELQAFELALSALTALAEGGDLAEGGAAQQPGGAAVRCTTHAARGNAEEVLVTVERMPPGGGAALGAVLENLPEGTYL
jgi:hypothetical protein